MFTPAATIAAAKWATAQAVDPTIPALPVAADWAAVYETMLGVADTGIWVAWGC